MAGTSKWAKKSGMRLHPRFFRFSFCGILICAGTACSIPGDGFPDCAMNKSVCRFAHRLRVCIDLRLFALRNTNAYIIKFLMILFGCTKLCFCLCHSLTTPLITSVYSKRKYKSRICVRTYCTNMKPQLNAICE